MIKPMVVDFEVDSSLSDGFHYYCFFYSQEKLGFTKSHLHFFWKKLYMGVGFENTCTSSKKWNVSRWNQDLSGMICKEFLLFIVTPFFHICTSMPKRVHEIPIVSHSFPFPWSKSVRHINPVFISWFPHFQLLSVRVRTISNVCSSLQNSILHKPAIPNSMHSQSKYTFTPPLLKHILYLKQLAEDLRNIFTSVGHARKSWTQPASSFPWFTSKTKRWNLGLILPGLQITGLQLC